MVTDTQQIIIGGVAVGTLCSVLGTMLYMRRDKKTIRTYQCTKCGAKMPANTKFCPECGQPSELPVPSQRVATMPAPTISLQKDNLPLPGGLPTTVKIPEGTGGTGFDRLSDGLGSYVYFILCLAAIFVPVIALAAFGLNIEIVVVFFLFPPVVGIFAGYMFKRFRTTQTARDLDTALKKGAAIVGHIGIDNKFRLVPFRRGSTGRWHGPQMKLNADSTHKATYPFAGTVAALAHSLTVSPLNPEFLFYAGQLLEFSQQIGDDGRKKNMAEIADIMQYLQEREKELSSLKSVVSDINAGKLSIDEYLDRQYHTLYWKDGKNFDQEVFNDLKRVMQNYCNDEGKLIDGELTRIKGAQQITVQHKNFHMEWRKDLSGKIIGGDLVEDRVLPFNDFRNALPTGGTAESSFLTEQFAITGGQLEKGLTNAQVAKYLFILMGILFSGVAGYLVIHALGVA